MAEGTNELKGNSQDNARRQRDIDVNDEMLDPLEDTVVIVAIESDEDDVTANPDDVDEARANMGRTIGAIQDRLRPSTLADQAKEAIADVGVKAKETLSDVTHSVVQKATEEAKGTFHAVVDPVRETVGGAVHTARDAGVTVFHNVADNRVPLAVTAFGIYLLYQNSKNGAKSLPTPSASSNGFGSRASEVKDQAGQVIGNVQDKAAEVVDRAQGKLSEARSQAMSTAQSGLGSLQRAHQENPLAMGLLAFGAGCLLAMMAPATELENRVLGEARGQFAETVGNKAQDLSQKVGTVAHEAFDAAKETAKQVAQDQGLTAAQIANGVS